MTILNVRSRYEFNQKEETEAFREVSVFYKTVKEEQLAWPAMATGQWVVMNTIVRVILG